MCKESNICLSCEGTGSLHLEGEIYKRQKKSNSLLGFWFVLLGNELYCYKKKGDVTHKEMRPLTGVFIKDEKEEVNEQGQVLYPFMLIFPNKRRIYFFTELKQKEVWFEAIKQCINYSNMYDYYQLHEILGKGKFGVVKRAVHKRTKLNVAVKIVKKKELSLKDLELLKREIGVVKILQHPSIIRFYDIFED